MYYNPVFWLIAIGIALTAGALLSGTVSFIRLPRGMSTSDKVVELTFMWMIWGMCFVAFLIGIINTNING